jgi:hypothetical protein
MRFFFAFLISLFICPVFANDNFQKNLDYCREKSRREGHFQLGFEEYREKKVHGPVGDVWEYGNQDWIKLSYQIEKPREWTVIDKIEYDPHILTLEFQPEERTKTIKAELCLISSTQVQLRMWEDDDGDLLDDNVRERANLCTISLERLSLEDQQYVADIVKSFQANYNGRKK